MKMNCSCGYSTGDLPTNICPVCYAEMEYSSNEQPLNLASEIPAQRMADEFGFPKTTFEVEASDLAITKGFLRKLADTTLSRNTLKELQALLERLP